VPLVQAEAAAPPPPAPPKPADAPSWREAAPPVRRTDNGQAPPRPKTNPTPAADAEPPTVLPASDEEPMEVSEPVELPPGQWEPPPVRRGADAAVPEVVEAATYPDGMHPDDLAYTAARKKRRARWIMAGIVMGMGFLLGGGGALVWFVMRDTEDKLLAQAMAELNEGKFGAAQTHFNDLYNKFPTSGRREEYAYLRQLSALRERLGTTRAPGEAFEELQSFLDEHKDEPYFKQHGRYYAEGVAKAVAGYTEAPEIDDTTPGAVVRAEALVEAVKVVLGDDAIKAEDDAKFSRAFAAIRKQHADWRHRAEVVKVIESLAETPTADALSAVKRLLKREEQQLPGIGQAPEVTRLLDRMYDGHLAGVRYVVADGPPQAAGREDPQPCILPDAKKPLRGVGGLPEGKPVLALARGVLFALDRKDGQAVWAMRVGIDSTTPPVHVPAAAGLSGLILILSTDTETLTAVNEESGAEEWHYRLSRPCLGRPVIVDRRAFLATRDGEVHEIDLIRGRPLGRYRLGQALTHGGVRQRGTPLVYFAAADSCVYVLNVDDHKCEAILYSDHASLRSEPVIVGDGAAGDAGGWLLLNQQAAGSDAVQLRAFELPVRPRQTGEVALKKVPPLPGLTWFAPHHDTEKLALLSDAGVLGLYGIRQARNRDEPLFPLLPGSGALDLAPFLHLGARPRGRAEVVRVQGDDFWVLALGQMQRLRMTWGGAEGPRMVAAWDRPLPLGSPLHASRFESDPETGRGVLFLTTRSLTLDDTCLATAVDDETGEVYWQRQLGMVCRGEPLSLRPEGGGPPLVLTMDQGGGLFAFDPTRFRPRPGRWERGGQHVAPPLEHNPHAAPVLLPGGDGASAFEVACPGDGKELVIRQVRAEAERLRLPDAAAGAVGAVVRHERVLVTRQVRLVRERRVKLDAPVQGTPAVAGPLLLLPLADGALYRIRWQQEDAAAEGGPVWRVPRAAADVRGHVAHLGGDRYLATDGARGLQVFQWTDKRHDLLPNAEGPTLELKDRVVAAPVVLPGGAVCVADAGGVVSLLAVGGDGSLTVKRQWPLGGRVPAVRLFVRQLGEAVRVGCVVLDREARRLVWLDPGADEVCWEHRAGGAIVGEPALAGGVLVVADAGGGYTALDPQTGRAEGEGYVLRGSIAPAAAPVAFGPDRLFAPLNDGTVMLLSPDQLRGP
jgi:outer membrane protein assembly factor BamB